MLSIPANVKEVKKVKNFIKVICFIYVGNETNRRKKNTYISGWILPLEELKEHIKNIKKKNGCNGTIKKYINDNKEIDVLLFQGDHIIFIVKYLRELDISIDNIHIRG